ATTCPVSRSWKICLAISGSYEPCRWMGSWGAMTPKPQVGLGNTPGAQNEVYGHLRCPQ
ncbi:unnamed protein product, partial [Effrenium voratum]